MTALVVVGVLFHVLLEMLPLLFKLRSEFIIPTPNMSSEGIISKAHTTLCARGSVRHTHLQRARESVQHLWIQLPAWRSTR